MRAVISALRLKITKLTEMKYFDEIYAAFFAAIALLGWSYFSIIGMCIIIFMTILSIVLTNDLKYSIPGMTYFVFTISHGFANNKIPIPLIIMVAIFILSLIVYTIINGIHLKRFKSVIGIFGFAVMNMLPIFWCKTIEKENSVFYFLFFLDLLYFLCYFFLANGIKKNSLHLLAVTFTYLGVILALECSIMVYRLRDSEDSIFRLLYYMGWGLCNEAGIMICVSLPFMFYLMATSSTIRGILFQNLKICICIIGLLLTSSRGTYLCGFVEIAILYVMLLFCAKRARAYQNLFAICFAVLILFVIIYKDTVIRVVQNVYDIVFERGFDDNERRKIWERALEVWDSNWLTRILGGGYNANIKYLSTADGWQDGPVVFHSTFFETLAIGGIFGVVCLIIHFTEKYWSLLQQNKKFLYIIGVGFIMVDLYGMIDNTYHMYYYMIPLMVIMACMDSTRDIGI